MNNLASILRTLTFFSLATAALPVLASNVAHQMVSDAARAYVLAQVSGQTGSAASIEVDVSPIDERIQVPQCAAPLDASASSNSLSQANVTVRVSCADTGWFLYVMARVRQMQPVVVTSVPLSPGTLLDRDQLEVVNLEINQLRGTTYTAIDELVGVRVKRRLRAGQPLVPSQLCFVCKGDNVVINASVGGLQIQASGVAEQDGNLGDNIMVKNTSSNKNIDARVISSSEVSVNI
ncbi:flagellar basal body P-ring formation chaperone FlgA [Bowmanella dokdonensis]|uniref:Flagella basal body P-ring formation protein FlgA n=1 Tax=Bowmanella dokdonensis TaxID=751969 RepID=A0A939IRS0_9ALTE|nr:flagellar basal body P-ring formation chaperone FlgA [Bowmanella dokdonensis]MBN7826379.1 flagellar basal body P-ring formation protein FlgA [Bowmanella dokdonensis]